jgi:hypothetical protein
MDEDELEPYRTAFARAMRTLAAQSLTPLRLLNPQASRSERFSVWLRSLRYRHLRYR